jgi:hypothetical protein
MDAIASPPPHSIFHEPFDLGLRQVFAGPQLAVGEPSGRNCSVYGSWGDQLEVRFGHDFRSFGLIDCSYNSHFINSVNGLQLPKV